MRRIISTKPSLKLSALLVLAAISISDNTLARTFINTSAEVMYAATASSEQNNVSDETSNTNNDNPAASAQAPSTSNSIKLLPSHCIGEAIVTTSGCSDLNPVQDVINQNIMNTTQGGGSGYQY